ncbi:paraquat-inducible protein A [Lentilitoribacter sp. EG35]|uniref:paraquat-inducible protein A n=1 Tax=Lentilitoribacter sp. EG35 TaxID=3234192 RepID=UPI00346092CC
MSSVTLTLGVVLPIMKFESFYFFDETTSIIDVITTLYVSEEYLLAALVASFSVIFPFTKQMAVLLEAINWNRQKNGVLMKLIPLLSKWSMMDVLLVALVIVAAKLSGVASAFSQIGLWFYASSTLLTIISHWLIHKRSSAILLAED